MSSTSSPSSPANTKCPLNQCPPRLWYKLLQHPAKQQQGRAEGIPHAVGVQNASCGPPRPIPPSGLRPASGCWDTLPASTPLYSHWNESKSANRITSLSCSIFSRSPLMPPDRIQIPPRGRRGPRAPSTQTLRSRTSGCFSPRRACCSPRRQQPHS